MADLAHEADEPDQEPAGDPAGATAITQRATTLAYFGRFTDELLYGAVDVLTPTFRAAFGLSFTQMGVLSTVLAYVAAVVEPVNGLLIDVWRRRWLIAWGALAIGAATVLIGIAPTFTFLLVAYALYGAGSGPLAHTADVVLVEGHRDDAARVFARATALDTVGALLGPALVTAWLWGGLDWRALLLVLGLAAMAYALALGHTDFPAPRGRRTRDARDSRGVATDLVASVRAVVADREALYWLVFLRVHFVMEAPYAYRAVWLAEEGHMSQALVATYVAVSTACGLLGVLALERWLHLLPRRSVLLAAAGGVVVLFPLWFATSSTAVRFAVGAPLSFLFALPWPIARSAMLDTASGRPGAVTAVNSLTGLLPIVLAVGALAEAVGLTSASLGTHLAGALGILVLAWFMPRTARGRADSGR